MQTRCEDYTVGWICAVEIERVVACALLDEEYANDKAPHISNSLDQNSYTFGRMHEHNVVIAGLPYGRHGSTSAAIVAAHMRSSFARIRTRLMVGIAGGAPSQSNDIRLGDVVVSSPVPNYGGVIQYDFGKTNQQHKFQITSSMAPPPDELLNAIGHLKAKHKVKGHQIDQTITDLIHKSPRLQEECRRPRSELDKLYRSDYVHLQVNKCECTKIGPSRRDSAEKDRHLIGRRERSPYEDNPRIFYGLIASANQVMKDAVARDSLIAKYNVLCFEMEAAGLMNNFSCLVIRGICDYSDSHKNDVWQGYAAATAAAYAKELISLIKRGDEESNTRSLPSNSGPAKVRYMLPALQNHRFVGREAILTELEQIFLSEDQRNVAVFGLGGIGKTQLALVFCYTIKAKYPEYSIFWLSALSASRFKQDCTRLAATCALSTDANEGDVLSLIQQYLSSDAAGPWLLVVDNADQKEIMLGDAYGNIADRLPERESCFTLITTRCKDMAVNLANNNIVSLDTMTLEEAELFMMKSLGRNASAITQDKRTTRELLNQLTCLPLAIAQACSYIIRTSISISKYLVLLKKTTEDEVVQLLSREFHDSTREKDSRNSVALTWLVSFDQILKEEPEAAKLLFFLAFVENRAVPQSMLPSSGSEGALTHAIGTLVGYSFLIRHGDDYEEVYDMHRLVHYAVKFWMQQEGVLEDWRNRTIAHIARVWPRSSWENRHLWQEYTPHAIRVLQESKHIYSKDMDSLCLGVGRCLKREARFQEGSYWIGECVRRQESLPKDDPERLLVQNELARAYWTNMQTDKAIKLSEKVAAVRQRILPEDHSNRLVSEQMLALAYMADGRVDEALHLMEKVVAIRQKLLPKVDSARLTSEYELAKIFVALGQIQKAIEMLDKVVAIRQSLHKPNHPHRLAVEQAQGVAYFHASKTKEAVVILETNVRVRGTQLAEDHSSQLTAQHDLARAYLYDGRIKDALEILKKVVLIRQRVLPPRHPFLLISTQLLASAYIHNGQVSEAIELLKVIVEDEKGLFQETHPERLHAQHELARAFSLNKQYSEAMELIEHVVAIRRKLLHGRHPDRLASQRLREDVYEARVMEQAIGNGHNVQPFGTSENSPWRQRWSIC